MARSISLNAPDMSVKRTLLYGAFAVPPPSRPPQQEPSIEAVPDFQPDEELVFDRELYTRANDFLDLEPRFKEAFDQMADGPLHSLDAVAELVSKATREEHIRAIAFAYAVWLRSSRSGAVQRYIAELGRKRERENKRTTNLHLLVEDIIRYGDKPNGKGRSDHRRLHNRDVAAIRYLHHQGVAPADVKDLASEGGEGLDAWSRRWAALKRKDKPAPASTPTPTPLTIAITIRSVDAAGKASREQFTIADNDWSRRLIDQLRGQRVDQTQASITLTSPATHL